MSIPYGRQDINQADIDAVVAAMRSEHLTQGRLVPQFEQAVANYCGAKHGVAVNSGTSALHIACLALGLGPADWLWTSPITFVASANCALYCGAQVDFVDIDPCTYNMSAEALERKLLSAEREGRLPKIVLPVHMCGQPSDMQAIQTLARRFGFKVIEDASHAIGGRYKEYAIGDGHYSDITVFSFHPVKIITSGEGGMALTNDAVAAEQMELLRSHGITRDPSHMTCAPHGPWYYQQIALGLNYRMTELQAALGLSQMDRVDAYVSRRRYLAERYDKRLAGLPITIPWQHPDSYSAFHLYVIRLQRQALGTSQRDIFEFMRRHGVEVNLHYIPVYTQPYFARMGFIPEQYPEAQRYYSEAMTLPLYPTMTEQQQDYVFSTLEQALRV